MIKWWILAIAAASIVLVAPRVTRACLCQPLSVDESIRYSDAVFVGTIQAVQYPPGYSEDSLVELSPETYEFRISASWFGAEQDKVLVTSNINGDTCGRAYQPNGTYLIYAYRDSEGKLADSSCSGSKLIHTASADLERLGPPVWPVASHTRVRPAVRDADEERAVAGAEAPPQTRSRCSVGGHATETPWLMLTAVLGAVIRRRRRKGVTPHVEEARAGATKRLHTARRGATAEIVGGKDAAAER